jgi:methionyl-tRNA formyltransferase
MRIAFAGTPAFAATALQGLLSAGYPVDLVLSQPDRPAGRGQRLQASEVKRVALEHRIAVFTPVSLRPERGGAPTVEALEALRGVAPDLLVVAAYGLLLPKSVLDLPRGRAIASGMVRAVNIHASLLPRWRGAAPIVRAIESGDTRTGISIMQMDAGLDTGPILQMEEVAIAADATGGSLTDELAQLGARCIVSALRAIDRGEARAAEQPQHGVTYAAKIDKREASIDWSEPAARIAARLRAFDPVPGARSAIAGHVVKIWRADAVGFGGDVAPAPGTVLRAGPEGIDIACGSGALRVTQLQRAGGKRLEAGTFLAGLPIEPGSRWERAPQT